MYIQTCRFVSFHVCQIFQAYSTIGLKVCKSLNLQVFKLNSTAKRGVVSNRGESLHRTNTLTQLEENSDDHTYDGKPRARFKEGNQSRGAASRHRYECVSQPDAY